MPERTDTAWRDALLMAPGRVAGVRLRPLSAWHCHAMQMTETRFCLGRDGCGPTPGELANAIAICRSRWTVGTIGVESAGAWLIIWLKCRWVFVDWRKDAMAMMMHVCRYREQPQVEVPAKQSASAAAEIGAPPHLARAVDLANRLPSVSLEHAMNMPYVWLNCLRATVADMRGSVRCAWAGSEGDTGREVAAGLQKAREAIERAQKAKQGATNGNSQG